MSGWIQTAMQQNTIVTVQSLVEFYWLFLILGSTLPKMPVTASQQAGLEQTDFTRKKNKEKLISKNKIEKWIFFLLQIQINSHAKVMKLLDLQVEIFLILRFHFINKNCIYLIFDGIRQRVLNRWSKLSEQKLRFFSKVKN